MPELPEAERARQQIEKVLDREIVAVDDRDTYVCRPHAPGEIAAALTGRRLTRAHRRGKFIWVETDGGPDLGLHLGMAGGSRSTSRSRRSAGPASRWTSPTGGASRCATSAASAGPSSSRTSPTSGRTPRRSAGRPSATASAAAPRR